jgi:DNA-binding IclR family transcriptional regulator
LATVRAAKKREDVDGAQTAHRALKILESFVGGTPSLSVAEVSDLVELTAPTTYRLLRALQAHQMVVWEKATRRYSLGPGVMRLANAILRRDDLLAVAQPILAELRRSTGETASLHWLVGHERVCLIELVSPHEIRMASGLGQAYPLYAGAPGKAILAWLDKSDVTSVIAAARATLGDRRAKPYPVIPDATKFVVELERVRKRGYAMSVGETVRGAGAIAVPLLDVSHRAFAAINLTGPVERWNTRIMRATAPDLIRAAGQIMSFFGLDAASPRRRTASAQVREFAAFSASR